MKYIRRCETLTLTTGRDFNIAFVEMYPAPVIPESVTLRSRCASQASYARVHYTCVSCCQKTTTALGSRPYSQRVAVRREGLCGRPYCQAKTMQCAWAEGLCSQAEDHGRCSQEPAQHRLNAIWCINPKIDCITPIYLIMTIAHLLNLIIRSKIYLVRTIVTKKILIAFRFKCFRRGTAHVLQAKVLDAFITLQRKLHKLQALQVTMLKNRSRNRSRNYSYAQSRNQSVQHSSVRILAGLCQQVFNELYSH